MWMKTHEEKQNKILKELKELENQQSRKNHVINIFNIKGRANAHKNEVLKGCGKRLGARQRKVRDSLWCNKYQLCPSCQKVLDKYKEMGI